METELSIFRNTDIEAIPTSAGSVEEILHAAEGRHVDALLTATHIQITERLFAGIDSLQMVSTYGIGVDHIDVDAASEHGVIITNVPDYSVSEVSTHAFSLLLSCARSVTQYDHHVGNGQWNWAAERPLRRLEGRTLGLMAFGKIARRLAAKVDGFGFDVIAHDPYVAGDVMGQRGVEKVAFDELLARSDFISTHTPLNEETYHIFDKTAFEKMKETAYFVNTSRGKVVDEEALFEALSEEEIAGAAIDVMEKEPPEESRMVDRENLVITPHVAWYSEQSMEELQRKAAEEVVAVLTGQSPRYRITADGVR